VVKIQTVAGQIESADMGLTLTHEHLLGDVTSWWHPPLDDSPRSRELVDEKVSISNIWELKHDPFINKDNLIVQDVELAIKEVQRFADQGGKTIIETSGYNDGRNPEGLATISKRTGLNIIMGTGYYLDGSQSEANDAKSERDIANDLIRDITEGAPGTKVKSGIIGEIGVGSEFTARERKSLAGSCIAQRETHLPMQIHMPAWFRLGDEVLDLCAAHGVPMESIVLCHSNPSGNDHAYQTRLLKRGAYLQYDMIGMQVFYADQQASCTSDEDDARNIARLVREFPAQREQTEQGDLVRGLPVRLVLERRNEALGARAELALGESAKFFPTDAALASWMAQADQGQAQIVYDESQKIVALPVVSM
jgi:phosphotriesterase-related protein